MARDLEFTYFSRVKTTKPLTPSRAYKVRIKIDGQDAIVRTIRFR